MMVPDYKLEHGPEQVFDEGYAADVVLACNSPETLWATIEFGATDAHRGLTLDMALAYCYPDFDDNLYPNCMLN